MPIFLYWFYSQLVQWPQLSVVNFLSLCSFLDHSVVTSLIHVCFPSGPLRVFKWTQYPTSLTQEHRGRLTTVSFVPDTLLFAVNKPCLHWFSTPWLLAPSPNSTWSLCWDTEMQISDFDFDMVSLFFQAQAFPLRSISMQI